MVHKFQINKNYYEMKKIFKFLKYLTSYVAKIFLDSTHRNIKKENVSGLIKTINK